MSERRPFREVVINSLEEARNHEELVILARQLRDAIIDGDIEGVISAWEDALARIGTDCGLFREVTESLVELKREAEEATQAKSSAQEVPEEIRQISEKYAMP